jgi:hypothetical protein
MQRRITQQQVDRRGGDQRAAGRWVELEDGANDLQHAARVAQAVAGDIVGDVQRHRHPARQAARERGGPAAARGGRRWRRPMARGTPAAPYKN